MSRNHDIVSDAVIPTQEYSVLWQEYNVHWQEYSANAMYFNNNTMYIIIQTWPSKVINCFQLSPSFYQCLCIILKIDKY